MHNGGVKEFNRKEREGRSMILKISFWIVAATVVLVAAVFLWLVFVAWAYATDKRTRLSEELEDNGTIEG